MLACVLVRSKKPSFSLPPPTPYLAHLNLHVYKTLFLFDYIHTFVTSASARNPKPIIPSQAPNVSSSSSYMAWPKCRPFTCWLIWGCG